MNESFPNLATPSECPEVPQAYVARPQTDKMYVAAQLVMVAAMFSILGLGLLPALLSGLLMYQIIFHSAPLLSRIGIVPAIGKPLVLIFVSATVLSVIWLGLVGFNSFINSGTGGLGDLMQKMADVVDMLRSHTGDWMQQYLPATAADLHVEASTWLRENAASVRMVGRNIGMSLLYILTGMIIGAMVAFHTARPPSQRGPLSAQMSERISILSEAFRRVVFSQIRISAINTLLTSVFLVLVLPLFDVHLPLLRVMIAVTFIAGLLPIIGNLISNTVLTLISLSVSGGAAMAVLAYLVVIHKLEYFLNAHIIGTNIRAKAWELLLAMLVMDAAFGIRGLIAAPIYYAYLKDELSRKGLI